MIEVEQFLHLLFCDCVIKEREREREREGERGRERERKRERERERERERGERGAIKIQPSIASGKLTVGRFIKLFR